MMAMPQEADIKSRDGDKDCEAAMAAEDDGVEEVEMVAVAVNGEQPYTCSCSKEKARKQLKACRGRGRKKKTVIKPPNPSFEVRVLPAATASADIQDDPFQIKSSTFQPDFDVTATTGEVEVHSNKTPTKSVEHRAAEIDEVLPVSNIVTTNGSVDGRAAETQYSPTSLLDFDIVATTGDKKDSELNDSLDSYEIKRKTQSMRDLDMLVGVVDDESVSSTVSLDEENENSTPPEANESTPEYSEINHLYDTYEIQRKTQSMRDLDLLLGGDDESVSSTFSLDTADSDIQNSPKSILDFDIIAAIGDKKDSELNDSLDSYEIQRKTQSMRDLDMLLGTVDDESVSSTVSLDEENENSTPPEANESKSRNGWIFSCTMDEIDDVVEDLISPLDNITNFISCERDDSIIIHHIENACADSSIVEDRI